MRGQVHQGWALQSPGAALCKSIRMEWRENRFDSPQKLKHKCNDGQSATDDKMEIPVLTLSLKLSFSSSTSFHLDKTLWGVLSAGVEQSRRKAKMVTQGDGKIGPTSGCEAFGSYISFLI